VGAWTGRDFQGAQLDFDEPDQMELWEYWVRATLFDFELLSNISFAKDGSAAVPRWAGLWHMHRTTIGTGTSAPKSSGRPIVQMTRPPDTGSFIADQLDFVNGYADLREDRAAEILVQMTPPVAFWCSLLPLHPTRNRWTMELLDVAMRFANSVEMRFKHALAFRRPNEYSAQVQPMIQTPRHSAFPSGHATEAHMAALVLRRLISPVYGTQSWGDQLMRQAHRIAVNRTVAGVHFPVDSAAGQALGLTLAEYFIQRCSASAANNFQPWKFDASGFHSKDDFNPIRHFNLQKFEQQQGLSSNGAIFADTVGGKTTVGKSRILAWLWNKAQGEWS
jgi:hypothetical protein